jgi:hypothetical protein
MSANSCHAMARNPLKRPAIVPSSSGREDYHTKIVLVG